MRVGFGAKPQGLAFGFWLGKLKITPKKVQFMSNFRMLTTKNTLNSAFLMPTPTLTGGELTKSGVKPPSDYSKKNFMIRPKSAKSVLFFAQK